MGFSYLFCVIRCSFVHLTGLADPHRVETSERAVTGLSSRRVSCCATGANRRLTPHPKRLPVTRKKPLPSRPFFSDQPLEPTGTHEDSES